MRQRAFSRWLAVLSLLYTVFAVWRDEFASPAQQEHWRALTFLPAWPASWWIAICAALTAIWILEASYKLQSSIQDAFAHGLALLRVVPSLDVRNPVNTLELRLEFENITSLPMKLHFLKYEYQIGTHFIRADILDTVVPAKKTTTIFPVCGLSAAQYDSLGEQSAGWIGYQIHYGYPNQALSRVTQKRLRLDTFKRDGGFSVNWIAVSEMDEAI